jgi:Tfp pilus assembly protein PilX
MKIKITKKEDRGFALLFSVLIASLLLTIGLSIFSIALKELAISTATRQSIHAFYAADSGREYARYQDLKTTNLFTYNNEANWSPDPVTITSIQGGVDLGEPNFKVTVTKMKPNNCDTLSDICTTITSYGYDTNSGDKVERAIFQSY